jgi:hypothetical protein
LAPGKRKRILKLIKFFGAIKMKTQNKNVVELNPDMTKLINDVIETGFEPETNAVLTILEKPSCANGTGYKHLHKANHWLSKACQLTVDNGLTVTNDDTINIVYKDKTFAVAASVLLARAIEALIGTDIDQQLTLMSHGYVSALQVPAYEIQAKSLLEEYSYIFGHPSDIKSLTKIADKRTKGAAHYQVTVDGYLDKADRQAIKNTMLSFGCTVFGAVCDQDGEFTGWLIDLPETE